MAQKRFRARGGGEIGDLIRHQAEIGRHPDRAQSKRCKHRPEHLVAILGMDQDAVTLDTPRAASPAASADTARSISRQVQDFSPQMKPIRSPWRRAFWSAYARDSSPGATSAPSRARGGHGHSLTHRDSTITLRKTDIKHLTSTISEVPYQKALRLPARGRSSTAATCRSTPSGGWTAFTARRSPCSAGI